MQIQVLISDSNVLIDLDEGRLLEKFFQLPYTFKVPDILYKEELEPYYPHLSTLGLLVGELTPESLIYAFEINGKYCGPSTNDCFALSLAKQERCTLLTGDLNLRKAADKEAVIIKGTIWVIEQMVIHELIIKDEAIVAYNLMKEAGSRLPWKMVEHSLAGM